MLRSSLVVAAILTCPGAAVVAQPQSWPSKPIRAVVPLGAGSTTDIVPRIVFEQLSTQLGQSIIVENKPGAGTVIGSAVVAKAAPDGLTLLVNSSAHTIAPALHKELTYHPVNDFMAVAPLGASASLLVVKPESGISSVNDLVASGKGKPGGLTFSSVGVGTATHLSAEKFLFKASLQATHVPYKGGAEALNEVIAGRVDFFFGPVGLVATSVREGKLRALLINSSERSVTFPDVPTAGELGLAGSEYPIWFGIFVPAKTPTEIVEKLNREVLAAVHSEKVRSKLAALGVDPFAMNPAEFGMYVKKAFDADAALVKAIGLKAE